MSENKKSPQIAATTSEDKNIQLDENVLGMMFKVLEQKLDSLILADKYHRHFHALYIFLILVLILFR